MQQAHFMNCGGGTLRGSCPWRRGQQQHVAVVDVQEATSAAGRAQHVNVLCHTIYDSMVGMPDTVLLLLANGVFIMRPSWLGA
jgi:hypothetical protein